MFKAISAQDREATNHISGNDDPRDQFTRRRRRSNKITNKKGGRDGCLLAGCTTVAVALQPLPSSAFVAQTTLKDQEQDQGLPGPGPGRMHPHQPHLKLAATEAVVPVSAVISCHQHQHLRPLLLLRRPAASTTGLVVHLAGLPLPMNSSVASLLVDSEYAMRLEHDPAQAD